MMHVKFRTIFSGSVRLVLSAIYTFLSFLSISGALFLVFGNKIIIFEELEIEKIGEL
jgi:hypothetical protein